MLKNKIRPQNFNRNSTNNSRNFFYRLFSSQIFLALVGLLLLLVIAIPLARTYSQRRLVGQEIQGVKKQINNYDTQRRQLQELLTYLHSDQSLEAQARLNLNMKKPGEGVVIVEKQNMNVIKNKTNSSVKPVSNLVKWWRYFFN